jgi:hypothetical protein
MVDRLELIAAQQLGQLAGIDPITLIPIFEERVLPRITHHQSVNVRLEQIVQPGRPSPFLEGHRQRSAQSGKELKKGCRFRLHDGFHDQLTRRIPHGYYNGCLVNVQPNILFIVHKGCSFS